MRAHRVLSGLDEARIGVGAEDGQVVLLGLRDDVPVTEIEAEQVGICFAVEVRALRLRAVIQALEDFASQPAVLMTPPARSASRHAEPLGNHSVGHAALYEGDSFGSDRRIVRLHAQRVTDRPFAVQGLSRVVARTSESSAGCGSRTRTSFRTIAFEAIMSTVPSTRRRADQECTWS